MPDTRTSSDATQTEGPSSPSPDDDRTVHVGGYGPSTATPTRLGRYIVVEQIGAGGMGRVFRAYDPKLRREVALKLLTAGGGESEGAARITREAQAMARLSHPNLVPVYDVEQDGDSVLASPSPPGSALPTLASQAATASRPAVFIAMEYVEGDTLQTWLGAATRSWREVLAAFVAAGRGLAAAHAEGVVHRDFKPTNVMVGTDGRVRVMDFGVARGVSEFATEMDAELPPLDATLSELTKAGTVIGTPPYMAPEQHVGAGVVPASDQYAFCVALWEALFGARPFAGADMQQLVEAKRRGVPAAPDTPMLDVPHWLYDALARGLAVDADARWPTMDALLAALERGQARSRRRRIVIAATAIGVVAAGLVIHRVLDERSRIAACEQAGASIAQLWNDQARDDLRAAMIATRASHAEIAAEKATPWLDAQAQAWRAARTEVCLDHDVRGAWTAETLDRSLWCLDERRMELEALVEELLHADATAVNKAVAAAAGLASVEPCRDAALLQRLPPPPAEQRDAIRAARAELSKAEALGAAGAIPQGLELARSARVHADELGWPPLSAAVRAREARLLEQAGEYDDAERTGAEAYFEAARVGAWDVAETAASNMIFLVGDRLARHDDALAWGRHAEVALAHAGDRDGLRESVRLANVAIVHTLAGDYPRARALHEQALAIREQALGPDHPFVAASLGSLSHVYDSIGESAQALALQERALDILERSLGPDHPQVASCLNNLANLHHGAGHYEQARQLYERSLAIEMKTLGPEHPDVGGRLLNLAAVYRSTGDLAESRKLSQRALDIFERSLAPDHPNLAAALNNLALAHVSAKEWVPARELYERALAIKQAAFGPDHPNVAKALYNLSIVHTATGDRAQARSMLERAVAIYDRHDGDQPGELDARFDLAQLSIQVAGDRPRALALAEQARDGWRAAGPAAATELATVEAWLSVHRERP